MTDVTDAGTQTRVSFGPRDDQSMPLAWAEDILAGLNKNHPHVFGTLLYHAATGNNLADYTRTGKPSAAAKNKNGHQDGH